jgi:Ca2+:H+ antiporter
MASDTPGAQRSRVHALPLWTIVAPVIGIIVLVGAGLDLGLGKILVAAIALSLAGSVFAAVHHAEVVAHRIGEPFGTLVLALAVTLIEVSLIVSLMLAGGTQTAALARDTIFATVMIILNGIIGLCLLVGGLRHREQSFSLDGVSAAIAALGAIIILTLVFPNYTLAIPGPYYSRSQLMVIAVVSLIIYAAFIFTQTFEHRGYFVVNGAADETSHHSAPPSNAITWLSGLLLLACLAAVVLLAKKLAPGLEAAVLRAGAPGARQHRIDHPGCQHPLDILGQAIGAWHQHGVHRAAGANAMDHRYRAAYRTHYYPARDIVAGDIRCVPVYDHRALTGQVQSTPC